MVFMLTGYNSNGLPQAKSKSLLGPYLGGPMRVARVIVSIFLAVIFSSPLPAQQPPPSADGVQPTVTRDPQALSLLSQCGTAMGGASISDTYATGTLTSADPNGPSGAIVAQTKGTKMRNDI